ncbi:permease prefix domain 1-containing protein [Acutalibacter caecimuris]|uniref:permease prefix domain 1-containing protein n=1 Tax=Acutalibacter caecimuris TaxID=3093657 RepID=UPI002AC91F60|nr:permease prefix domain 1-containing protein [Acutalibacter sp. M00118]
MEYKIREYMDQLFESAPRTQRAYELKIELTQNLIDKYYALVGEGKEPEEAFNLTVMSIGDVRELFAQLEDDENGQPVPQPVFYPQPQPDQRRAIVRMAAVMLFVLSVVPPIVGGEMFGDWGGEVLGPVGMFVMIAIGVGLLVYDKFTHPTVPQPVPGTVVQDFRQWQGRKAKKKHWIAAFNGAFWPLVLAVYFLLSFATGKWYITWVIFLIAPAVDVIVNTLLKSIMDKDRI